MAPRPSLMAPTMASASLESSPSGLKGLSYSKGHFKESIFNMILWNLKSFPTCSQISSFIFCFDSLSLISSRCASIVSGNSSFTSSGSGSGSLKILHIDDSRLATMELNSTYLTHPTMQLFDGSNLTWAIWRGGKESSTA